MYLISKLSRIGTIEKERIILSDCDGVLINWNDGFDSFMKEQGYTPISNTDDQYNLAIRYNVEETKIDSYVREFNNNSYIEYLEPLADSVKYVKKFTKLGFRFIIITSIGNSLKAKFYRTKNLNNIFGDIFDEIHCIKIGSSKSYELSKWAGTGYFWIEDHMRHAEAGYEVGLKPILIDHPYNRHYNTDLFPRVNNTTPWKEIYDIIIKEYNL